MNNADKPATELTKRELFAAMAMQGMLSAPNGLENGQSAIADIAVDQADTLLVFLEKARGVLASNRTSRRFEGHSKKLTDISTRNRTSGVVGV